MPPIKPGRWSVNPADIDPINLNLWNRLVSLVPIWENNPRVHDVIWTGGANNPATPTNVTTQSMKFGPTLAFDGVDDYLEWDTAISPYGGLTELSWVIVIRPNDITNAQSFVRKDGTFNFQFSPDAGLDRWLIGLWPGGTLSVNRFLDPVIIDTWYVVVGRWRSSDQQLTISDRGLDDPSGIVRTQSLSVSPTGALGNTGSNQYRWGTTEGGNEDANADVAFFAAWDRKLSDPEAAQLVRDPFGMIRPSPSVASAFASLYSTVDATIVDVVNEVDAGSPLWSSINDDPETPTDTDWINNEVEV